VCLSPFLYLLMCLSFSSFLFIFLPSYV
jgi:hypothetical protein